MLASFLELAETICFSILIVQWRGIVESKGSKLSPCLVSLPHSLLPGSLGVPFPGIALFGKLICCFGKLISCFVWRIEFNLNGRRCSAICLQAFITAAPLRSVPVLPPVAVALGTWPPFWSILWERANHRVCARISNVYPRHVHSQLFSGHLFAKLVLWIFWLAWSIFV